MKPADSWVAVAIIGRPHALRGAVSVRPLTRTLDEFEAAPLKRVYLRQNGKIIGQRVIESISVHKGSPLVCFEGVDDRNAAEELRGVEIVIPEEERWALPEGQYYADDLEGLDVVDAESGDTLGTVLRAEEGSAHDYLIIAHPRDSERELMIPKVDQVVHRIDIENHRIIVKLPEGLLEI